MKSNLIVLIGMIFLMGCEKSIVHQPGQETIIISVDSNKIVYITPIIINNKDVISWFSFKTDSNMNYIDLAIEHGKLQLPSIFTPGKNYTIYLRTHFVAGGLPNGYDIITVGELKLN